jgi:ribosomal protein S18 acetylase RimI-like enzyme
MKEITLRKANTHDTDFVNDLTRQVMASYVEKTWSSPEQREFYFQNNRFDICTTEIIQHKGKDIGRLSVVWFEDHAYIDNIHLLPEYHGMGIGKIVIQKILDEAKTRNIFARLMVLKVNPAKKLYESLGFRVYKEDAERFYMRTS